MIPSIRARIVSAPISSTIATSIAAPIKQRKTISFELPKRDRIFIFKIGISFSKRKHTIVY
jgi:hypothetical protein